MNPERIWFALCLLVVVILGVNLFAFGMLSGAKGGGFEALRRAREKFSGPSRQDAAYEELHQKVEQLKKQGDTSNRAENSDTTLT
jgi:hypothetical protein